MLNCSKLGIIIKYKRDLIPLEQIESDIVITPTPQEKTKLIELGQVTLLTVIQNGKGKYSLIEGDPTYAAMLDLYAQGNQQFAIADCLVVDSRRLEEPIRDLIIRYHPVEYGRKNMDAHRLEWIETLLIVAEQKKIPQADVIFLVAELIHQSTRYARMYVTIASSAISEVREAVITPASGRRKKSQHITVERAAHIAGYPAEEQRDKLYKLQSHITEKNASTLTGRQKTVLSWLESVKKQINQSKAVKTKDMELLEQSNRIYQLTTYST